ncbi:MAG: choice-of-anchor Q domain-containing protein [Polyangiales bacterium]
MIDNDVVLDGGGNIVVHGNDAHRVFSILAGASVEILGFRVTGGVATRRIDDQSCGGLANAGTLMLVNSVVSGNTAATGGGGGICNSGLLTLINSAVEGNSAKACGGVFNNGWVAIRNSTVSENKATSGGGGGICSSGPLMLAGSTVSGNSASYSGGIENSGTLTLTNSTVSGNVSEEGSGGILNIGTATLESGTVAGNTVAGLRGDIRNEGALAIANTLIDGVCIGSTAAITSEGNNIESPGDTCGFDTNKGDQFDVTAQQLNLGPLSDNGGPTMTHALRFGSVAIDRIPEIACETEEDHRGVARPQGAACDVGAFELEQEEP